MGKETKPSEKLVVGELALAATKERAEWKFHSEVLKRLAPSRSFCREISACQVELVIIGSQQGAEDRILLVDIKTTTSA